MAIMIERSLSKKRKKPQTLTDIVTLVPICPLKWTLQKILAPYVHFRGHSNPLPCSPYFSSATALIRVLRTPYS